jgi:hypothetical protein
MAKRYGLVHAIAKCQDCGWEAGKYKNAQACAANHAKKYGHKVTGEVAYAFEY